MDPDLKLLLEKNLETSRQILVIVQKLHRTAIWQRVFTSVKWILIIALTIFSYLQIQPYLGTLYGVYGNALKTLPAIQNLPSDLQSLLK